MIVRKRVRAPRVIAYLGASPLECEKQVQEGMVLSNNFALSLQTNQHLSFGPTNPQFSMSIAGTEHSDCACVCLPHQGQFRWWLGT